MSYITTISPDRLAWCCHLFGISTDELAAEVHLSPDRFTVEALQQKGLTFTQLSTVAKFFGRGVLFFTEQSAEAPTPQLDHVAQFRTFQNHKPELSLRLKQLVDRVARQRQIYLNLVDDLDDDQPCMFDPVGLPDGDIRKAAAWVRRWLGLGERNDYDTYRQAVERCGILVFGPHGYKGPWQLAK